MARGCLAFRPQLLGVAGGHQFSPCPQPVLGSHLQTELRKLAEGLHRFYWAQGNKRRREELESETSLPPHPGWLQGGTVVAFWLQARPDPRRPIRYNHWDQSQPLEVEVVCLKKKKKKRQKGYSLLQAQSFKFQDVKKNLSQPRGLNIRSQPDQAHVALGQVHCCFAAQLASTPHLPHLMPTPTPSSPPLLLLPLPPLLWGVTPGRLRRDTGESEGEGHKIQPDALKLSREPRGGE